MSIEALPVTNTTLVESLESVESYQIESPVDAEVTLLTVRSLQERKETLFIGLARLGTQMSVEPIDRIQPTFLTLADEYYELDATIDQLVMKLKKDHPHATLPAPEISKERRVPLHDESIVIIELLHKLQTRHAALTMGMIALAEGSRILDSATATHDKPVDTDEHRKLANLITVLRKDQGVLITTMSACNQTVTRPRENDKDPNNEANKAERRRIEQPYVIQLHNNGEDPTHNDDLPEHLTGLRYRYLTNAAL